MPEQDENLKTPRNKTNTGRNQTDLSSFVFDKVPPQALDLEEVVLGGMMLDRDAVAEIIDILKPDSFYLEAHRHIYQAIYDLFGKAQPIDIITVCEQLRKNGKLEAAGGPYYVSKLTNRVATAANIEHHARIISEKFILRELIKSSTQVVQNAYEETTDVFDLLNTAEQSLFSITEQNLRRSYDKMNTLIAQAIKNLEALKEHNTEGLTGVPTGFPALDRLTSGWQKSDLIIIAARPAMGKTAFVLSVARNAAVDFKRPVAVFSLEMSKLQLVNRLISAETGLASEKLRRGDLQPYEWVQLTSRVDRLSEAPIIIDDTPAINLFELRAKCRRFKMQHDIQLIIIDYLQLMSGTSADKKNFNREQEISNISRTLKTIAKELDVPVIALSQLSRAVETRGGDKRPQLADLRESGAIEQDADLVLFLYRPEYYGLEYDADQQPTRGIAEVIIAKHRNGPLDTVKLKFIGQHVKFENLDIDPVKGNEVEPIGDIIIRGSRTGYNSSSSIDDEEVPF
ncbi:replicative DNA helicase [Sphingobacteriales bacterium UPWRP_1]|nr:replicative DNA helicase [Sphingobacteriales bacterium TSM_CSM]PSJ74999.1 replicative DNA helicase [Sphingobacteriales bacterium UPWRP_1]